MNLFFSKLTGKLWSTDKLETHIARMEADIARYRQVDSSDELVEYKQLKQIVESAEFAKKKQTLTQTKYKTTKFYLTMQELKGFEKDKTFKMYLALKDSQQLRDYQKFRAGDEYVKLSDKNLVQQSPDLKNMLQFENSKEYKAYLQCQQGTMPTKYEALKKEISSEEFQKENAFWANPQRWLTTQEHLQEARLKQLSALSDIQFYLKQDSKKISEMEQFVLTFSDEFQWIKLAESQWKPGFNYKNKALKSQHSFANEQQANNYGKNAGTINGIFTILTKRETITAPAWDTKKGFINKEFAFTSDVLQTADNFRQQEGLFMIKLRSCGKIHHAAWLGADSRLPLLTLFHFNGKNIVVGNTASDGFAGEKITGINASAYYIYSIRWTKNELIWYVNNMEVYRTRRNIPQEALYLALCSFISENQKAQEGKLEVDWVRVYKH